MAQNKVQYIKRQTIKYASRGWFSVLGLLLFLKLNISRSFVISRKLWPSVKKFAQLWIGNVFTVHCSVGGVDFWIFKIFSV
jgi:hypothetical protein